MIGGNIQAILQQKDGSSINQIGERIQTWKDVQTLTGWLDLTTGSANYSNYNAKLQESSHNFICDYVPIDRDPTNKRMMINGVAYDVLFIDNPMELNQHLEIYLRQVG